jgi:hypothetical protein
MSFKSGAFLFLAYYSFYPTCFISHAVITKMPSPISLLIVLSVNIACIDCIVLEVKSWLQTNKKGR